MAWGDGMRLVLLAVACMALSRGWPTQRVHTLGMANTEVAQPFTRLYSVAELADGRVVATDSRERVVRLMDLRRGAESTVGRVGSGPGEFLVPRRIIRLPADTLWIEDPGNARWLVLDGSAKPVGTMDARTDALLRSAELLGVGPRGDLFLMREGHGTGSPLSGSSGVGTIVRFRRGAQGVDTVVTLRRPTGRFRGAQSLGGGLVKEVDSRPLAPEDVAAVSPEGDILVLRSPEYRLERWRAGTRVHVAAPVAYDVRPVTLEDKRAFLRRQVRPGGVFLLTQSGIQPAPEVPRSAQVSIEAEMGRLPWPEHLPPFRGAILIDLDGRVWVERVTPYPDSIPLYDVLNAEGRLAARVRLPAGTQLVAFGKRAVYLVRRDEDDLQYLQRYDAPRLSATR